MSTIFSDLKTLFSSPKMFLVWTLARLLTLAWIFVTMIAAAVPFGALVGYMSDSILTSESITSASQMANETMSGASQMPSEETLMAYAPQIIDENLLPFLLSLLGIFGLLLVLIIWGSYGTLLMQSVALDVLQKRHTFTFTDWKSMALAARYRAGLKASCVLLWRTSIPLLIWLSLVIGACAVYVMLFPELLQSLVVEATEWVDASQRWNLPVLFWGIALISGLTVLTLIPFLIWTIALAMRYLFGGILVIRAGLPCGEAFERSAEMTRYMRWKLFVSITLGVIIIALLDGGVRQLATTIFWQLGVGDQSFDYATVRVNYSIFSFVKVLILWLIFGGLRDFVIASLFKKLSSHS